jgi:WhiB family transcriptional regulator, redox-sensing transcriptional regulator
MISANTELMRHLRMYMEKEWRWMENAGCHDADPDLFYPENGKFSTPGVKTAIRICRDCPVINDCLQWALKTGDSFGVLGGMTPQQRTRYRREVEYLRTVRKMKIR